MNAVVQYESRDGVAVITVDNPPVNALSTDVAEALGEAVDQALEDGEVRSMVIAGAGRTFIAGADIAALQEMAWGRKPSDPMLHDLLLRIEDAPKLVVIAIHGTALGGGLELAMAGHYRVAAATAQLGQPEVTLGIIPGAGGTQRLPRLAGVEKAIEMCVSGKPIGAMEALAIGLIDSVPEEDVLAQAVASARRGVTGRRTRTCNERLGTPDENRALFEAGRQLAAKTHRNQTAPLRALEAIEAATAVPFEEGCRRELELFQECVVSDQAKALMHSFFAERAAARIPHLDKSLVPLPVARIAIIGAGTMGGGIAMACVNAGIPILLRDTDAEALERGMATIRRNYDTSVKRGRLTEQEAERRIALIQPQTGWDQFEQADLVLEAAFENMAVKRQIFQEIDRVAKPGCILATNTSTLSIDEIASVTARPESVVGMHFFSPANVMRLLEVVRGKTTSPAVLITAMAMAKQLKKVGVLVGNCPGFAGNRLFFPYMYEAQFLVEDGATPEQVDRALTEFGMAMGIFAVDDLAGIDVAWRVREELRYFSEQGARKPVLQEQLFASGRYGQKTGRGWYTYGADRRPVSDPEVARMIERSARETGIQRRSISDEEIVQRLLYALVNEGARVLEEGFALRASDIDVIYVNGYGFPSWRGGPMFFADLTGLKQILARIETFHREMGARWTPAPLLQRLAFEGRTFRDFDQEQRA